MHRHRLDRSAQRRPRARHGRRCRRHDRVRRDGHCTGRDGCGPTEQDRTSVSTAATVERAGAHDQQGKADRTASVEKGVGLPSASAGGERLLPVHVNHWRGASGAECRRTDSRDAARVQRPESDDRPGNATVLQYRSVTRLPVGVDARQPRFMHQRRFNSSWRVVPGRYSRFGIHQQDTFRASKNSG